MTLRQLSRTTAVSAALAMSTPVWAQQPGHQMGTAQTQPASQIAVAECAQAQRQAMRTIDAADLRLEVARQNNSPPAMRAAVDDLQDALRQLRAQLAACAALQAASPADVHAGHRMPGTVQAPGTAMMPPGGTPTAPAAATPGAPAAKPADPHAGHTPAPAKPSAAKPSAIAAKPTAPAAKPADPHAGHTMPAKPASPSATRPGTPAGKSGAPAAKPVDPHAGHPMTSAPAPSKPTASGEMTHDVPKEAIDPVSGTKVDPATATSTTYKGKVYYFSSAQDRLKFIRNPEIYLKKGPGKR